MLRNYLQVALRNLAANKLHAVINIGGLAVGLAACLLILLYVRDELSYERWLPNSDRIVAVESNFFVPGREKLAFGGTPGPMKPAMDQAFSSEIQRAVRVYQDELPVLAGDRRLLAELTFGDPGFFEVFDLRMIAGNREAALADNASMIVSQTTARRFFGDAPAVGQTLTVGEDRVYTVVGVFADLPRNTHLAFDTIALFDTARYTKQPWVAESWTSVNTRLYLLLRDGGARARIDAGLPAFVDRVVDIDVPGFDEAPSTLMRFDLLPIRDIHLHADKPGYARTGSFTAVVAFAGIALLILVVACINFVNLATARAMSRAREVAMRKVVGATRAQLVRQHLGEAIFTALLALAVALALVELSLAPFNGFLDKELRLELAGDPILLVAIVGLVAAVGVIGGLYPALYLSRFRPAAVLKANQSSAQGGSLLRTGLVVFQFAISIALVICTATIYRQTLYARTLDLGFAHQDRVILDGLGDLPSPDTKHTLKRELAALPGVRAATLSDDAPPLQNQNNSLFFADAAGTGERLLIEQLRVDPDFFTVYGVAPVAGRLFSLDHPSDFAPSSDDLPAGTTQGVVINRAFVHKLGAARPEDVIGRELWQPLDEGKPMIRTIIVGVVDDLHLRSLREPITPFVYFAVGPEGRFVNRLSLHVAPGRMRETLAGVQAVWSRLAPTVPLRTRFVDDTLAEQYAADRQRGQIFAGFAAFAILIACLGLFGLASFAAQRRTKEIGMRKVLGASVLDIVRLLVWQFSRPVLVANLVAWPISYYVMQRWLGQFRYHVDLAAPSVFLPIFGGAALLAIAIAWLTTAGHAYRVARANPGRALRTE